MSKHVTGPTNIKTAYPEENEGEMHGDIAPGEGDTAHGVYEARNHYVRSYYATWSLYQLNQTNPVQPIATTSTQTLSLEAHIAQQEGSIPLVSEEQASEYEQWANYFPMANNIYWQMLTSLSNPTDIAEQIVQQCLLPDDVNTPVFLNVLLENIGDGEEIDTRFSSANVERVLSSLDTLKNHSDIWRIIGKILPHLDDNHLFAMEQIDIVLRNLDGCVEQNTFTDRYALVSDILFFLLDSITDHTEKDTYIVPKEILPKVLQSISYQYIPDILPTFLPHISHHTKIDYLIPKNLLIPLFTGLNGVAYYVSRQTAVDILTVMLPHVQELAQDLTVKEIGILMSGIRGMRNTRIEIWGEEILDPDSTVDQFLSILYPQIEKAKAVLDTASIGIILQSLEGKQASDAVKKILICINEVIQNIKVEAKHISMAISGLRAAYCEESTVLISNLFDRLDNTPERLIDQNAQRVQVRLLLYSLASYAQETVLIEKAQKFLINTQNKELSLFKDGVPKFPTILPYLIKIQEEDEWILDLHDCAYPLAKALCEYAIIDFTVYLAEAKNAELTIIFGQSTHNEANAEKMKRLVEMVCEELLDENWKQEWPEDNDGRVIIYSSEELSEDSALEKVI